MMSKALLLVVLGFAAVLVNAAPEPRRSLRIRRGVGDQVKAHINQVLEKTNNFFLKIKNIWTKFWDRVTGKESIRKQQEINKLKTELHQLQEQSEKALAAEKAVWQKKLAAEEAELQRLQNDKKAVAAAKERLLALQKEYANAINNIVNDYDHKVDKLDGRVEKALRQ